MAGKEGLLPALGLQGPLEVPLGWAPVSGTSEAECLRSEALGAEILGFAALAAVASELKGQDTEDLMFEIQGYGSGFGDLGCGNSADGGLQVAVGRQALCSGGLQDRVREGAAGVPQSHAVYAGHAGLL